MRVSGKAEPAIPKEELWLHTPPARETLDRAIEWAENNPPKASDLDKLARSLPSPAGSRRKRRRLKARVG